MKDRSVIQWDKDDLDALGLLKVDILAIGMLSAIRRSLEYIAARLRRPFEMQDIPDDDTATYDMICRADTVGVFQIESRAQMSMLPRLKPRRYYDLVVEVAIVRPGPIQGGMVHPYLRNRTLPESEIDCPEELKPALLRTKGVPIFQEQVMQIAMLAADFTAGEADALRRAMAAWKRRGGLSPFHRRLVDRMVQKGYTPEYAERIFKQIQGFGEYGFPESHAAGFALLAYVSSWLKCHHPDAFLCGLLNAQPMGFYAPAQLVRDARQHGVEVRPVCVVRSGVESTMEEADRIGPRQAVRLGLNRVKGLDEKSIERIAATRAEAPFANVEDLARRARLDAKALGALARANALQPIAGHRFQAAWAVAGVDTRPTEMLRATGTRGVEHEPPVPLAPPSEAQTTLADYRALGLTLGRHPVALVRDRLAAFRILPAMSLLTLPHGRLARASGLVTHPATAGDGEGHRLRHARGRDRRRQRHRLAADRRAAAPAAVGRDAAHGLWHVAEAGRGRHRGHAPPRCAHGRPHAAARGTLDDEPGFPLRPRRPAAECAAMAEDTAATPAASAAGSRPQQQMVTSELRDWIVAQAAAGHTPEAVLEAMKQSGWNEETALDALETTLTRELVGDPSGGAPGSAARPTIAARLARRAEAVPPGVPVPGATLDLQRARADAGDRSVEILSWLHKPRIVVFGGLLSSAECDELVALARTRLARSETIDTATGGNAVNAARTSEGMFFEPAEFPVCARLEARLARLLDWPAENGEGLQILRYRQGAEYKPHYDWFEPSDAGRRRSCSAAASAWPRSSAT
jgi:hypothetical protein